MAKKTSVEKHRRQMFAAVQRGVPIREVARRSQVALVPYNSDFKMSWTSMRITSISMPCLAENQPDNPFSVRFSTHSQDGVSTSDQELLSLVKGRTSS